MHDAWFEADANGEGVHVAHVQPALLNHRTRMVGDGLGTVHEGTRMIEDCLLRHKTAEDCVNRAGDKPGLSRHK